MKTARFFLAAAALTCASAAARPGYQRFAPIMASSSSRPASPPIRRSSALSAGGTISAQRAGSSCRSFITNAPDVRLHYEAGNYPLIISVDADLTFKSRAGCWPAHAGRIP